MTVFKIYEPTRTIGNGATVNFVADFQVADVTELVIKLIDTGATTNEVLQIITTDYTVAINETTENATVTFLTPPPGTKDVIIERVLAETQPTKIPDVATIRENILEGSYDKNTKLVQQLSEKIGRQLATSVVNDTLLTYDYDLPLAVDGRALFWSVSGVNASIVNSTTDLSDINASVVASQAAQTGAELAETNAQTSETNAGNSATASAASAVSSAASAVAAAASAGSIGVNKVEWNSPTTDTVVIADGSVFTGVDSSTIFAFTSDRTFDITGTGGDLGALNTGTSATNTWYFLIALGDTSAVVAPHIIGVSEANYASFTTADLTGNYSAYDDYKRIGAIYFDGGSDLFAMSHIDGTTYFNQVKAGSTTSSSYVDSPNASIFLPTFARKCRCMFDGAGDAFIRFKGNTGSGLQVTQSGDDLSADIMLDASQVFEVKTSTGTLRWDFNSYEDDLSVEGQ